jgi:hypothetical protein
MLVSVLSAAGLVKSQEIGSIILFLKVVMMKGDGTDEFVLVIDNQGNFRRRFQGFQHSQQHLRIDDHFRTSVLSHHGC